MAVEAPPLVPSHPAAPPSEIIKPPVVVRQKTDGPTFGQKYRDAFAKLEKTTEASPSAPPAEEPLKPDAKEVQTPKEVQAKEPAPASKPSGPLEAALGESK